ncbi:MAG: hypothetical protein CFH19_00797 [Alphaproteobacteria bacterium MarineAlpha5_Bin9]|nr:MAG: hypothetical protein CFH19_00797 [Alphaproteobacteria bacterium MarineAlpha5_Bin9]|tara:strand:- start:26513 stop:26893 length:381 start_codon:yes stop_codon:yes gene_type:complete
MDSLKYIIFLLFFSYLPLYANYLDGSSVDLQILDKVTARITNLNILVGEKYYFDSLEIEIFDCKKKPPEEIPENYVLLSIKEKLKNDNHKQIFQGWMLSSSPSLSPFEHPTYDIWIKDCNILIDSE